MWRMQEHIEAHKNMNPKTTPITTRLGIVFSKVNQYRVMQIYDIQFALMKRQRSQQPSLSWKQALVPNWTGKYTLAGPSVNHLLGYGPRLEGQTQDLHVVTVTEQANEVLFFKHGVFNCFEDTVISKRRCNTRRHTWANTTRYSTLDSQEALRQSKLIQELIDLKQSQAFERRNSTQPPTKQRFYGERINVYYTIHAGSHTNWYYTIPGRTTLTQSKAFRKEEQSVLHNMQKPVLSQKLRNTRTLTLLHNSSF